MTRLDQRTPQEVFESHLEHRMEGRVEEDIAENYAEDVIILSGLGAFRGHDGIRTTAANLDRYQPNATYEYRTKRVEGNIAFLEWRSESPLGEVQDGADSFVIRAGKIAAQTIHYTVIRHDS